MGDALVVMTVPEEAWITPMGEKAQKSTRPQPKAEVESRFVVTFLLSH